MIDRVSPLVAPSDEAYVLVSWRIEGIQFSIGCSNGHKIQLSLETLKRDEGKHVQNVVGYLSRISIVGRLQN